MFKENDNMRPGPTLERVLAVCRLADQGQGSYTVQDMFKLCSLNDEADTKDEAIRLSINAAIEIGFIEKSDDKKIQLKTDRKYLESSVSFRKAVSSVVFNTNKKESTFFKLTEWFISHSYNVLKLNKFDEFAVDAATSKDGLPSITNNDVLVWRFWMRGLGFAYVYNKTLIPNMKTRLEDAFELGKIQKGTRMTCTQFVSWLKDNVPEAASSCNRTRLPLAISNGLRCLDNEKRIKLISTRDAVRTSLFPIDGAEFNDFSEIVIRGSEA